MTRLCRPSRGRPGLGWRGESAPPHRSPRPPLGRRWDPWQRLTWDPGVTSSGDGRKALGQAAAVHGPLPGSEGFVWALGGNSPLSRKGKKKAGEKEVKEEGKREEEGDWGRGVGSEQDAPPQPGWAKPPLGTSSLARG